MNLALTIEKMKEVCNEYGFVCENGSIYYRKNIDVNLLYFLTKNTSSSIYTHKLLQRIVEHGIKEYKQEIMLNNISKDFV